MSADLSSNNPIHTTRGTIRATYRQAKTFQQWNQWLNEQDKQWYELEQLLHKARHSTQRLNQIELYRLGQLYRATLIDLARSQTRDDYKQTTPYLNNLCQRTHALIHQSPPTHLSSISHFILERFPQTFRKHSILIGLAFFVFLIFSILAMITIYIDPDTERFFLPVSVIEQLKNGTLWVDLKSAAASESTLLMQNNIRVALNAFAGGIFFGIGALVMMAYNGLFAFGGPLQVCYQYGLGNRLLFFVMAHGVIELVTIFIAGGAGMVIGTAMVFPGDSSRWDAVKTNANDALTLMLGCIPLLVIAGLIEGLVSLNDAISPAIKIIIALFSAVFLIAYLGFSGRSTQRASAQDTPVNPSL